MTAAQAALTADRYAEIIASQTRSMMQVPDPWPAALIELNIKQALGDGTPVDGVTLPPHPQDARKVREMTYMAQDAGVRRLWLRNRVAYSIDTDLWEQLAYTSEKTELPEDLFSKLPHPDPFVALPQPLILPLTHGKLQQRIEGFFVTGRGRVLGGAAQLSTHSPGSSGDLGLLIVGPTETLSGKPYMLSGMGQDAVLTRVTLRRGIKTLAGHIEDIGSRFDFAPYSAGDRSDLARSLTACVSALIYICARNAEMRPVPGATIKRAAKGLVGKPPRVIEVGFETGAKLRAYKQREQAERGPGTGRTMRPHVRRAHLHTFKVGPGRSEIDVKWLDPIFVNTEDKDAVKDKTTVVGVE